jgi:hypothetical protein
MALNMVEWVKKEIKRLIEVEFIRLVRYVEWISNIVIVLKKNNMLRVCIDFRNLNLTLRKMNTLYQWMIC